MAVDKVRMGFIGVGNRGTQLLERFVVQPDVVVVALCDVYEPYLGPRAARPYQHNLAPYFFRWWSGYSSQLGNWGVHYLDVIRWLMGETAPVAVSAMGGRLTVDDDRTIPDTLVATFQFASGALARFDLLESAGGQEIPNGEVELRGSSGYAVVSQDGYAIHPSQAGQFQQRREASEVEEHRLTGERRYGDLQIKEDTTVALIRDFLDCVKERRQPLCSLEEGHRSTTFAHLGNTALTLGRALRWDAEAERFPDDGEANALPHYEYREP